MKNELANKFFITGLPRSRTAWLSSFFTGNNCFCYHEVIRISKSFDEAIGKMLNRKEMYVGNSDSSLPIWANEIDHILQHSPIVIVERDIDEVTNSLINLWGCDPTRFLDLTLEHLEILKKRYNYISIDYNKLSDQSCLESIWDFCIPNIDFDEDKFKMLKTINISIDKESYMKDLIDKDGNIKKGLENLTQYINKKY